MANRSITQLQVAGPLTGMEIFPLVQGGITKQALLLEIAQFTQQDILNDTTTATPLYPVFATVTSGNASTLYTSDPNYLYTPSLGLLESKVLQADNGIVVNNSTVNESYTLLSGTNGVSGGPMTVAGGAIVTVQGSAVWSIVGATTMAPWYIDYSSPTKLVIKNNGSAVASINNTGNVVAAGSVTAFGAP